jgi:MinD-like ATPase involved in chromosome partitioning or flagellar assembly
LDDPAVDPASLTLKTDVPSLRFLPAGQTRQNSTELLASRRLTEALSALVDPDTIILIDSSPLLATTEASALADRVGHTVVVVEAGRTSVSDLSSVMKILDDASSSVSLILNKVPRTAGGRGRQDGHYYYGHQYGY